MKEYDKEMKEISKDALNKITALLKENGCKTYYDLLKKLVSLAKWIDMEDIQKDEEVCVICMKEVDKESVILCKECAMEYKIIDKY